AAEQPDEVTLSLGDALAIRRLLWDVGSTDGLDHDKKVECFHWGAVLNHCAGMPAWPGSNAGDEQAIALRASGGACSDGPRPTQKWVTANASSAVRTRAGLCSDDRHRVDFDQQLRQPKRRNANERVGRQRIRLAEHLL